MPEPSKPSTPRNWRGSVSTRPSGPKRSSARGKVVAVGIVMLLLAGAIAGVVYWINPIPQPHFVALWIDQYQDPRIPVNAWAAQDRQALLGLAWNEKNTFSRQERHLLLAELRGLEARSDKPVVIFLSAFAVTDDDGEVYVLPGDARLDQRENWLLLREVLKLVAACPAERKLLILDIMRPLIAPQFGFLTNDQAERTLATVEAALPDDPQLLVLCACAPGQISLDLEDEGHSLFGYYLLQGLMGQADGNNDKQKRNGRVSVRELAAFVRARVDRWARDNRGAHQTPVLLGTADDFPLVGVRGEHRTEPEDVAEAETYPSWLRAGWALLDEWRAGTGPRVSVDTYRDLETTLVRAEQHWRGGTDPERIQAVLKTSAGRFKQQRDELAAAGKSEPRSLAQAVAQGRKPPDLSESDVLPRFRDLAELDARTQVVVKDEKAKDKQTKDKEKLTADQKAFLKKFEGKPFEFAWALVEATVREPVLRPEHVRTASDLLALYASDKKTDPFPYGEVRFLRRLAEWGRTVKEVWPGDAVHDALLVVREAERTALADSRALPWVRQLRDQAAQQQREGERLLFSRDPASWQKAGQTLRDALDQHKTVNRHVLILDQAYRVRDDALALLPGYESYLEVDRNDEDAWKSAIETARGLREVLAKPESRDPVLTDMLKKMDDLAGTLRDQLNKLGQPLQADRLKRMIAQSEHGRADTWRELDNLLACPWLTAPQREALWNASRLLSARLHAETVERDLAEDQAGQATGTPSVFDSARAIRLERERALERCQHSIVLLQLDGRNSAKDATEALNRTRANPNDPSTWLDLRQKLRRGWTPP